MTDSLVKCTESSSKLELIEQLMLLVSNSVDELQTFVSETKDTHSKPSMSDETVTTLQYGNNQTFEQQKIPSSTVSNRVTASTSIRTPMQQSSWILIPVQLQNLEQLIGLRKQQQHLLNCTKTQLKPNNEKKTTIVPAYVELTLDTKEKNKFIDEQLHR
ncbi:unnamed protein product [Didymodactylos carnosus]|uniref:Uncharacterized protein n=1 Tax=Didymodactylos carnosus TaxID=1234261 RepID=A0A813XE70_9BILA|nr:unnamed protein product [Didymodactylos carnosus]CAF1601947.1 unnamed protein product [Didymodactylos carnosus]CAF3651104.1 unnamed protein product [Didymodactylos carnosus]CAF4410849.1 unnamed protein product [Didymodactylos carnosus]